MTDEEHTTHDNGLLQRIRTAFHHEKPESREALIAVLKQAQNDKLITPDVMKMMEGALEVSELCAADLMVQRSQIEAVDLSESGKYGSRNSLLGDIRGFRWWTAIWMK